MTSPAPSSYFKPSLEPCKALPKPVWSLLLFPAAFLVSQHGMEPWNLKRDSEAPPEISTPPHFCSLLAQSQT